MAFAQAIQVLNIPDHAGSGPPYSNTNGRAKQKGYVQGTTTPDPDWVDYGYHLNGSGSADMSAAKAKLTRLANFGPSGVVPRALTITDGFGTKGSITNISQLQSYDIIFIGTYFRDPEFGTPFTPSEINILLTWSKQAGKVLMVQEQSSSTRFPEANPISSEMEYGITSSALTPNTSALPADIDMNTKLFSGVFGNVSGTISQNGTSKGYFSAGCDGIPIAKNGGGLPTIILNQTYRDILVADIDFFTFLPSADTNTQMSNGGGISSKADKVWANLWAWAVNEVVNNVSPSAYVTTAGIAYSDDLPLCPGATSITVKVRDHNGDIRRWQTSTNGGANWSPIPGSEGQSSITVANPIAGQEFRVRVGNPGCAEVSDVVVVTVFNTGAPTVTSSLVSACPETSVNLASAHTGTIPPGTQLVWFNNSAHTGTPLTAAQIAGATAGTYYAFYQTIGNVACYSPASNMVTVTITPCPTCTDPVISTPPTGGTYCQGTTATALSVTATGTSLSYQWYSNTTNSTSGGTPVGTNSSTYTPIITASGTLFYYVIVTSGTCTTTSSTAMVTVNAKPTAPVASASTLSNTCPFATVDLTTLQPANISGISYEWHTVATNPSAGTLVSPSTAVSVGGVYYLYSKTTAGCYSNASSPVTVTIITCPTCTNPVITTPPTGANYCQNATATPLSVTATGATSYQWYSNTTNSTSGGTPVGTNSSTYLPVITASGTLFYYVVLTSGTCSTTSATAMVTVTAKPTAPVVSASTLSNFCPVTTANLTTLQPAVVSGIDYEWHTVATNPTALTKVDNPSAVSLGGIYYLYSKTTTGGCYSNASSPVTVTINTCTTPSCTNSGVTFVDLTALYTGTLPTGVVVEWWTSPTRDLPPTPGTKVLNPTNVTVSGTYYAFFYDTANNCYNTNNSTASVVVNILPPCATCIKPGNTSPTGGIPTKVGITVQAKQANWPEKIPNGFMALESKEKGFVITRVLKVGGGPGGAPNLSTDSVKDPKEGMLVYDKTAQCVKLYNGTIWKCIQGCD